MKRNLRFKLDWASLIVGRKFTAFALLYFAFDQQFPSTSPRGLIFGGRFNAGFFVLRVWGLIIGGAYTWKGLFSEFYGILQRDVQKFAGSSRTHMPCHCLHKNWQQTVATFSLNMFSV